MAVVLYLTSGDRRRPEQADGARLNDPFFIVARHYPEIAHTHTVLTILAKDVVAAEVLENDVRIDFVLGLGGPPKTNQEA